MTEAIERMSRRPVAGWREEDFASGPEEDSVLLTLMLDILRHDAAERGVDLQLFWAEAWLAHRSLRVMLDIGQDGARWRTVTAEIQGRGASETVELEFMASIMCPRLYSALDKEAIGGAKDRVWMERVLMQYWERFY